MSQVERRQRPPKAERLIVRGVVEASRLLAAAGGRLSVALWSLVAVGALIPVALAVATASAVSASRGAYIGGLHSAAGHRLVVSLVVFAVLYGGSSLLSPFGNLLTDTVTRRVDGHLGERVMRSAIGPTGVRHLEDEGMQKAFLAARNRSSLGMSPGGIVAAMVPVVTYRISQAAVAVALCLVWWPIGVPMLVLGAVNQVAMCRAFGRVLTGARGVLDERFAHYHRDLAITAPAAKEVRVFGLSSWLETRYRVSLAEARTAAKRAGTNEFNGPLLVLLAVNAGVAVVSIVWLGHLAVGGRIGLGALAFAIGAVRTLGPSLFVPDAFMTYGIGSLDLILNAERLSHRADLVAPGSAPAIGCPAQAIRFEAVSFRYPGSDTEVLRGLDLEIRAGERVALVGLNGAGKTTIVKLLCKLYEPTEGRIVVDGEELSDLEPAAWRRQIGVLFQDFVRFELALADNVRYGAVDLPNDQPRIERVASRIGVDRIASALPDGWATPLSAKVQGGVDLSGGQWQRVAFARALYAAEAGARILVLDEPTANLDVRAEAELYDQFMQLTSGEDGALTTLLISHRFSTVRQADRIVVLDGGAVIEDGSHDQLMADNGRYAAMFRAQADRFGAGGEPTSQLETA